MNGAMSDAGTRKRDAAAGGAAGAAGGPVTKKARLAVAAADDDEDDEGGAGVDQELESFRKEAIWRQMQDYKRRYERAQRDVDDLAQTRRACESRLSAVEMSWKLLVEEADLLLPSTSTAGNGHSSAATSPDVSDPNLNDEDLQQALAQRSAATKALLSRLHALHPAASDSSSGKSAELEDKCRHLLQQSLLSQESLRLLRLQHDATVEQLELTHAELVRAEKRLDRLKSATVRAMEQRGTAAAAPAEAEDEDKSKIKPEESPSGNLGVPNAGVKAEGGTSPSPAPPASGSGLAPSLAEIEELKATLEGRTRDLEELRTDRVALRRELDGLKTKLADLPEDAIVSSTPFRLLQSHVQHLAADSEARRADLDRVAREADSLREAQESFRVKTMGDAAEQVEDVQKRLAAKEGDLSRIRAQREDLRSETLELKAKDSAKLRHVDQISKLNASLEERVKAYESQMQRLRMEINALKGDGDSVDMLSKSGEGDIVADLQGRLKTAEDLLRAVSEQLVSYTSRSGLSEAEALSKSETQARLDLSTANARLAKLEALFGAEGGDAERATLAKKVEEQAAKLESLEAQVKAQDPTMEALYSEIERLSGAWQTLDEQNSAKVWNMASTEEKMQRLSVEKAKADNRYFGMCRQHENFTAENAVLHKLAEKQRAAKEVQDDVHRSLGEQLSALEKEVSTHQRNVRAHQDHITTLRRENDGLTVKNEQNTKRIADLTGSLSERAGQVEAEAAARKAAEEQVGKMQRELKNFKAVSGPAPTGGTGEVKQLREYNADLQKMLKCSTCLSRFKSVVLTRCGHMFCKECVEARLVNRQRKCPSCANAFGKDDMMTVYL